METNKPAVKKIAVVYTNHRGKEELRTITPHAVEWVEGDKWHPDGQFLMSAYDWGKKANRTFALSKMRFTQIEVE